MALQSVLLDDRMEIEVLRLNQLRDRASEKGQKKGVRECVKKLKLLKTPEERERWLREIPEVHSDPKLNPDYESDDTEEYFNNEHGEHLKPKFPWLSGTNTITSKKTADDLNDQPKDSVVALAPVDEDSSKSNTGKDVTGLSGSERPQSKVDCNSSSVSICKLETIVGSSKSNTGKVVTGLSGSERPQCKVDSNDSSVSICKPETVVGSCKSNTGKDVTGLTGSERPQSKVDCNGSSVSICKPETVVGSSKSNTEKVVTGLSGFERPQSKVDCNGSSVSTCKPETVVGSSKSNTGKDVTRLTGSERPQSKVDCNGTSISICKPETVVGSSKSNTGKEVTGLSGSERPQNKVDCSDSSASICKPETVVGSSKSNTGKHVTVLTVSKRPQSKVDCNGSSVSICKPETVVGSSLSSIASESRTHSFLSMLNNRFVDDDRWHYRDLSGNVQGPFSMVQLQKWSTSGYFPADMRIWAGREADSLLLNNVLREHFHHFDGQWPENAACNSKVDNQVECVTVCIEIPSSTIPATSYAVNNSVNLEKIPDNLTCDAPSVVSLTKTNELTGQFGTQNMPDINQHAASVFTVADAALLDLPIPLLKKENRETKKIRDSGDKEQSKLLVQESGNPPSWSTTLSLVAGGTQLPETGDEWGRYPPTVDHQVATANSTMDQITNFPSWHGLGETIEFSTLAEESVSDLLAEVDAMESRNGNGAPSPTSRRNSFLEDLFNGSMDDFSPTADQGTRSDGFSSTADIHLSRQSTGLPFSFGLETKPTCAVSIPQTTNSDNLGFKWAEMGSSVLQPPRQDMIDLNYSTRAETDEGERENRTHHDQIEEKSKAHTIVMAETRVGGKLDEKAGEHIKAEVAGTKIPGLPEVEVEEGEIIQPEATPQPPAPQPLPPSPTMGLDVVDPRRVGSGRQSQGTTSTGRVHAHTCASRSGNVQESHHRRSGGGGDRYNGKSNSPRERGHHVEDVRYDRGSRASWSRQSSFSGGSGYSRPPSKGQHVCKFYENGRCKKGSACNYLHPQDR